MSEYARVLQVRQQPAGPYVAEPEHALDRATDASPRVESKRAILAHCWAKTRHSRPVASAEQTRQSMGPAREVLTVFKRILSLHGPTVAGFCAKRVPLRPSQDPVEHACKRAGGRHGEGSGCAPGTLLKSLRWHQRIAVRTHRR